MSEYGMGFAACEKPMGASGRYVQMATTLCGTDAAFLGFGMCAPYTLAMQLRTIRMEFDDVCASRIRKVRTVMLAKHRESKEMRGLMKLVRKEKDKRAGFKLTYEGVKSIIERKTKAGEISQPWEIFENLLGEKTYGARGRKAD